MPEILIAALAQIGAFHQIGKDEIAVKAQQGIAVEQQRRNPADQHQVIGQGPQRPRIGGQKDEEGQRYSVLYEFNDSKAITTYEKYLTEIVTPKIPTGGTVIIHGYTDIIGDETNNRNL